MADRCQMEQDEPLPETLLPPATLLISFRGFLLNHETFLRCSGSSGFPKAVHIS